MSDFDWIKNTKPTLKTLIDENFFEEGDLVSVSGSFDWDITVGEYLSSVEDLRFIIIDPEVNFSGNLTIRFVPQSSSKSTYKYMVDNYNTEYLDSVTTTIFFDEFDVLVVNWVKRDDKLIYGT